jgi:cis-L-3-hydroxyproline dehydratase
MAETTSKGRGAPGVELSDVDRAVLAGSEGEAARRAMRIIVRIAEIQRAPKLIDISHVHVGGSIYTGPGSLEVIERLLTAGAKVRVPTTVNAISIDRRRGRVPEGGEEYARNADRLAAVLEAMGCRPIFSCTPYVFPDTPELGQDVLWAESNAIVYANSVIGARTNRHGDFMDVFAAITGRVPYSGLHRSENRVGNFLVEVPDVLDPDPHFFAVLGYLIGKEAGSHVPVIEGIGHAPSLESMKALCSTVAAAGAVALLHMVGVTPEAPTLEAALGGRKPDRTLTVTREDLRDVWRDMSSGRGRELHSVLIGSPHATLGDFVELADRVRGRKKDSRVDLLVTTSRFVHEQAEQQGLLDVLTEFGARVSTDTCLCMLNEQQLPSGTVGVMTNSGKFAHYGPGLINRGVYFGSTQDCVESAVLGRPAIAEPGWLNSWGR